MVLLVLPQIAYAGDQSPKNKKLIRVHELIDQADSCLTAGNYEQTRLFCKEANGLIKNRKKYRNEYEVIRYITAESYIRERNYSDGITLLKELEHDGIEVVEKGSFYGILGQASLYGGNVDDAIYYLEKSEIFYPEEYGKDDYFWRGIELRLAIAYALNNQADIASDKINTIIDYGENTLEEDDFIGLLSYLNDNFIKDETGNVVWHDKVGIRIVQGLVDYTKKNEYWEGYVSFEGELAYLYQILGDFQSAYTHYTNAISHCQPHFHIYLSILYSGAAAAASRMNEFDNAHALLAKAEESVKTEGDEEWREYQKKKILEDKAILYIDQAVNIEGAIEILEGILSDDSIRPSQKATTLYNLGQAYELLEDYYKAYDIYKLALDYYDKYEGHGILYAKTLNKSGVSLLRQGDTVTASQYFDLCIDIFRRLSDTNNYSYILTLGNAARSAFSMQEYGRALAFAEECRELQLKTGSIFYAEIWDVLLDCYSVLHDTSNHNKIYGEIKEIFKDDRYSQITFALNDSQDLFYEGKVEEGFELFNTALELYNDYPDSPRKDYLKEYIYDRRSLFYPQGDNLFTYYTNLLSTADSLDTDNKWALSRLANDFCNEKDYVSANLFFHLTYPTWTREPAFLYNGFLSAANCGDIEFINELSHDIEGHIQSQMKSVIGLSDAEKELYWADILDFKNLLFSRINANSDIGLLYNVSLSCKSFLLRSNIVLFNLIAESGDKEAITNSKDLKETRKKLNSRDSKCSPEYVDSLRIREIELNRIMVSRIKNYSASGFISPKTWQDVQVALKSNELAIEIDDYPSANGDRQYIAFLIDKTMENPVMVNLCLDSELNKYMNIEPQKLYNPTLPFSEQLYKLIWQPLLPYMANNRRICISTSGKLSTIAIEAIINTSGEYVSDLYTISRMTSTSEVCDSEKTEYAKTAAVYGGIRYDNNPENNDESTSLNVETTGYLQDRSGEETIDYLPGTMTEASMVSSILKAQDVQTNTFFGYDATESSFKSLSGSSEALIHIATHGFYKPSEQIRRIGFYSTGDSSINVHPMSRSGLLMAGCNDAWNGLFSHSGEDGVLTASEIADLDLSSTQLVVLSACETGLGEVTEDGIAGLQRAFKNAGVQSLIMSLWKVDDKATSILMEEFYTLLSKGIDKNNAFRQAQEKLRHKKQFNNPYYWASFIVLD